MPESNIVEMYKQGYSIKEIVAKVTKIDSLTKANAQVKVMHEVAQYISNKNKENPPAETDGQAI